MNGRSVRSRSLPCLSKHLQGGGKQKKRQKRKSRGDKDSFTLSAWDYFTSPSPSSPFSPLQKQIHKEKGRGNYSSMLLHKKPVALLPVVFLLWPEQTLFSCPSPGEITTGKCFPSYTLSWLGIIYIKLLWKLLPSPSSAGYLQATGDSLGEVGSRRNPLWICSTHETSWGGLSPLQRGTCPCREATPRTAGSGERGHPRLIPPAVNPGISPARPFIFMTFSYGQHLFLTFFFFPSSPCASLPAAAEAARAQGSTPAGAARCTATTHAPAKLLPCPRPLFQGGRKHFWQTWASGLLPASPLAAEDRSEGK